MEIKSHTAKGAAANDVEELKLKIVITGESTYWPVDSKRLPDLVDSKIAGGLATNYVKCESCFELSLDHSPIMITLLTSVIEKGRACRLHSKRTN